jgi:8-oxo-dGTP pyrophosphatase MutT (NUDIX family)
MRKFLNLVFTIYRLRWRITRPVTIGVRLILIQNGQALLVRHTYQPGWYLPGGGVKRNETLEQSARREAAEEAGAILGEIRLHGIFTLYYSGKSDHTVVFACEQFHGMRRKIGKLPAL